MARKTALLTVGSTAFTPLVHSFLQPSVLIALAFLGVDDVYAQVGTSTLPFEWKEGVQSAHGLRVEVVRFSSDIEERVGEVQLVISHAGAGSILSFLRPSTSSGSPSTLQSTSSAPSASRRLILVPNSTLMDSHQSDLADEMSKKGWAIVCERPEDLPVTLELLANEAARKDGLEKPTYPELDENKVQRILDETLGYV
ncbi:hypothetical protein JCM8547_005263 [Rhodosporidiobolus lusitaniae]